MKKYLYDFVNEYNTKLIDELVVLTPVQINFLLYDLFSKGCPVQINDNFSIETFDKIGFFRLCEEFLKIIQRENLLKQTPKGWLQKKVVKELYDYRFIPEILIESGVSKNFIEQEIISIGTVKTICKKAGLIKNTNNILSLTAKGRKLITPEKRHVLLKLILETFINKYYWGFNDGYPDCKMGQYGLGYILIVLNQLGSEQTDLRYFSDKYLAVFPNLLKFFEDKMWATALDQFFYCFEVRVFERFLYWFNLVNVVEKDNKLYGQNDIISVADVFHDIFLFKM
jgi:hypothetical protein